MPLWNLYHSQGSLTEAERNKAEAAVPKQVATDVTIVTNATLRADAYLNCLPSLSGSG